MSKAPLHFQTIFMGHPKMAVSGGTLKDKAEKLSTRTALVLLFLRGAAKMVKLKDFLRKW